MLGHKRRDLVVPAGRARAVQPGGGMFRPVVVVDGWVVGTWTHGRRKRRSVFRAASFEALDVASQRRLEEEAADIGRFLGEGPSVEVATAGWVPGGVGCGLLVVTLLMVLLRRRCPALVVRFRPRADLLPAVSTARRAGSP